MVLTKIPGRSDIELPAFYDSFEWYYPDCELQTKEWFVKNAQSNWVYLDCGAHIGYYSILFSQLSPKGEVHAIEPTSTAEMLSKNISHNQCHNVTIHKVAVGKFPGARVEKVFRIWGRDPEVMEYEFTTVDHFVEKIKLSKLDCLKIDVDSFDFEVLMGAEKVLKDYDPWLVVELNHALSVRGYSNMAALSWLLERGYQHCLVLDFDNFIFRRSAPPSAFNGEMPICLHFPIP